MNECEKSTRSMGQTIRRLRIEQNLTQETLAELLGVTSQAISKWENNVGLPDIAQIVPLAGVFGVTTDVLFGLDSTTEETEVQTILHDAQMKIIYGDLDSYLAAYDHISVGLRRYPGNLTLLIDGGVDLHSYQPSAKDMAKISSADMFVYVGGSSDAWVLDAVRETANKNMKKVNMMELLGDRAKEEEVVEGMQSDEHGHSHTGDDDSEHSDASDEDTEYDEHIWLSLKNAKVLTQQLANVIKELDSENADEYQSNADAYIKQLSDLDKEYETVISSSRLDTVVFGDRFPFRYLVDDYNLDYYAAFAGCSAETEASFKTVTFLAGKVDEIGTKVILAIDGSDEKIANTIKDNTKDKNQEILVLDSMQSVKTTESDDYNYINVMVKNLTVLKQALA